MEKRKRKYEIFYVIFLALFTIGYFIFNYVTSEQRGIKAYQTALEIYKNADYETAYQEFAKVPYASNLKEPALFRQARCATNMGKKELAIRKYGKIVRSRSKSSIVPISEYNMAILMMEVKDNRAQKYFKKIIKKHPTSDYAIAAEYYLGKIILSNLPEKGKKKAKQIEKASLHFKNYIEKSPDGRFGLKSAEELIALKTPLKNYDNLMISKVYYANGEFEKAKDFLNKTTLAESWTDFVKTEYKLGNKDKVKYYTEYGLKDYADRVQEKDLYEVIDYYIAVSSSKKAGIEELLSKKYTSSGADYIEYLNCRDITGEKSKNACYLSLYEKYPNGQFSADALYNLFISKYLHKKYHDAQRLGYLHLEKFPNVKSTPAVTYFMGRIANKLKHYETAKNYYKQVLHKYPDSYYAYRANCSLYKSDGTMPFADLTQNAVVFPYKKSLDNNLVVRLALLKDYDLVDELCKKDKFIQSWIAYQKGNYTVSAILARNAMDELTVKPPFTDLRWRLIYPLHYYKTVDKYKGENNPIILQSIIKEESHFNPYAKSIVGASGLMQLMPATFDEISKNAGIGNDIFSENDNIRAGSIYYSRLRNALSNKDLFAISAYNGGIGSVTSWFSRLTYNDMDEFVEQIPYPETKNYVKKVLRSYWVYGNVY